MPEQAGSITTEDALKAVRRVEETEGAAGAYPNAQRTDIFDTTDIQARRPNEQLYFVNTSDPGNVLFHQNRGRVKCTGKDARKIGNSELFAKPMELHRRHLAEEKAMNVARLAKARKDHEILAERIAKELRDEHGIHVSAERLIREEIRG